MATKERPGQFDCYANAMPDEPMFILLARDPDFARLVHEWANKRERDIKCGERPSEDFQMVNDARYCATQGANWRKNNFGTWRKS